MDIILEILKTIFICKTSKKQKAKNLAKKMAKQNKQQTLTH